MIPQPLSQPFQVSTITNEQTLLLRIRADEPMRQPHVSTRTYEQSSQVNTCTDEQASRGSSWNHEQTSCEHKNLWAILTGEHKNLWAILTGEHKHRWASLTGELVNQWAILTKGAREPMSNRTGKHKINEQASQIGTCMGFPLLKFAHVCIYLPPKNNSSPMSYHSCWHIHRAIYWYFSCLGRQAL